jgi:transcriptional regulator with XRE-family HTH domain
MKINSEQIKQLRKEKKWSQSQLSEVCGLNLRTIQRLESTGKASLETVRALAAVFQVEADTLLERQEVFEPPFFLAIKKSIQGYADFSGRTNVADYWWFFLAVVIVLAIAHVIHPKVNILTSLLILIPFLAAGQRRLNDAGQSGWWQLMWFIPFGQVVVIYLLTTKQQTSIKNKV